MTNWPSIINPDWDGLEETNHYPLHKTDSEAGYSITRPSALRSKLQLKLRWSAMPELDYQTLKTFFEANQGGTFSWTHPVSNETYTVRFTSDDLIGSTKSFGFRHVECALGEV